MSFAKVMIHQDYCLSELGKTIFQQQHGCREKRRKKLQPVSAMRLHEPPAIPITKGDGTSAADSAIFTNQAPAKISEIRQTFSRISEFWSDVYYLFFAMFAQVDWKYAK